MAKENGKAEAPAEEAPAPKKSKKLLVIVAIVLVLLLAAGGGGAYMIMKNRHADGEGENTDTAHVEKKKEAPPVYIQLDTFTVNLVPETTEQFLQAAISVEVSDPLIGEKIKMYTPKLRNNVMILLSGKKASELLPREGKEALAQEIRTMINGVVAPDAPPEEQPVREVLFTSFIIQ